MLRLKYLYIVLCLKFCFISIGQNIKTSEIDSFINIIEKKDKGMGSFLIMKNNKTLYSRNFGFQSIEGTNKVSINDSTRFRIGSVTKVFTATMIFQLIEEHKLKLYDTLNRFFPAIKNSNQITIKDLLSHRSGLSDFTSSENYLEYMYSPKTKNELLKILYDLPIEFNPNEKTEYSNTNFLILGFIIEEITKLKYAENLKYRITSRLNLKNTYVGNEKIDFSKESKSFEYLNEWIPSQETNMTIPGGAGCIISTTRDLAFFLESIFSKTILSNESLNNMLLIKDGIGMGLLKLPFYNKVIYGHNGSIDNFNSLLSYNIQDSVIISYCSNGQVYPCNNIASTILCIIYNKNYIIPTFNHLNLSLNELNKYTGIYINSELNMEINFFENKGVLYGQATGQSAIPLEPEELNIFKYYQAGLTIEFIKKNNELILKQGFENHIFVKKN